MIQLTLKVDSRADPHHSWQGTDIQVADVLLEGKGVHHASHRFSSLLQCARKTQLQSTDYMETQLLVSHPLSVVVQVVASLNAVRA